MTEVQIFVDTTTRVRSAIWSYDEGHVSQQEILQ